MLRAALVATLASIALAGPGGPVPGGAPLTHQSAAVKAVDREDADTLTPLMRASATGDLAKVNALLAQGADPDARNSTQRLTALMCAAYFARVDVVQTLLAKGARLGLKDTSGAAAVDWATLGDGAALQKMLTGDGAALNPFLNVGVMPVWLMDKAAEKPK